MSHSASHPLRARRDIIGGSSFTHDITNRMRMERRCGEAKSGSGWSHATKDASRIGIASGRYGGVITFGAFGYSQEKQNRCEACGNVHLEDRDACGAPSRLLLQGTPTLTNRVPVRRADDSYAVLERTYIAYAIWTTHALSAQ